MNTKQSAILIKTFGLSFALNAFWMPTPTEPFHRKCGTGLKCSKHAPAARSSLWTDSTWVWISVDMLHHTVHPLNVFRFFCLPHKVIFVIDPQNLPWTSSLPRTHICVGELTVKLCKTVLLFCAHLCKVEWRRTLHLAKMFTFFWVFHCWRSVHPIKRKEMDWQLRSDLFNSHKVMFCWLGRQWWWKCFCLSVVTSDGNLWKSAM